jgi:hypothetical protein
VTTCDVKTSGAGAARTGRDALARLGHEALLPELASFGRWGRLLSCFTLVVWEGVRAVSEGTSPVQTRAPALFTLEVPWESSRLLFLVPSLA